MKNSIKVLFAYDGSRCADVAIEDLPRAGLPEKSDAMVVSVADFTRTAITNHKELRILGKFLSSRLLEETVKVTESETARLVNETKKMAYYGARLFLANMPGWSVDHQAHVGEPAAELLRAAKDWKPDLIIVGSHGRSAIGRFFLGSVSEQVAREANCSVRVARCGFEKPDESPNKIIIGAGTLQDAEKLFQTVGRRAWPDNTEVRLVKVDDGVSAGRVSAVYPYAGAIFEQAMDDLRAAGLKVSAVIKSGNLKSVLLESAEIWKPDSIFVVAGGKESNLNETATGLITNAPCTVEVVR